jgi:hypothetical protein
MKVSARLCSMALFVSVSLGSMHSHAVPPESGISYQGQLYQDGMPVDGMRDFRFRLYDDAVAGNLIETVQVMNVEIVSGLFSVEIDFGETPWETNEQFWLQIEAGPADGMQNYEIISRMKLSAVPYALNTRGIRVDSANTVSVGPTLRLENPDQSDWSIFSGSQGRFGIQDASAGSTRLIINSVGNFDMGGLTPASRLELSNIGSLDGVRMLGFGESEDPNFYFSSGFSPSNENNYMTLDTNIGGVGPIMAWKASGAVGIGTIMPQPESKLTLADGDLPIASHPSAPLVLTSDHDNAYLHMLTPNALASGILFGDEGRSTKGGIIYRNNIDRMEFRTVENLTRMSIDNLGNVGVGVIAPASRLDVRYSAGNGIEVTDTSSSSSSIAIHGTVGTGTGVRGVSTAGSGSTFGVYGQVASPSGWGVYSNGRLGASGTKSFMIDHPLDPTGSYLLHYSSESPQPQNRYNGNVRLDGDGRAVVVLPDYFASINTDHRYTLTPIGAPAPNLFIESEIRGNSFVIAGGVPGQKVSWEVVSHRNDEFVRQRGAPIELPKVGAERGRYLVPSLYGAPESMGIYFKPAARD